MGKVILLRRVTGAGFGKRLRADSLQNNIGRSIGPSSGTLPFLIGSYKGWDVRWWCTSRILNLDGRRDWQMRRINKVGTA